MHGFKYSNMTFLRQFFGVWRLQYLFICIVRHTLLKRHFFEIVPTRGARAINVTLSRPLFYICCTDSTSSSSIFYLGQPISRILATIVFNFYCTFLCIILLTKLNVTHRYRLLFYVLNNIKILCVKFYIFWKILID